MPNMCNRNSIESSMKLFFFFIRHFLAFLSQNLSLFDVLERTSEAVTSPERYLFKVTSKQLTFEFDSVTFPLHTILKSVTFA